ncbi:MAG: hypothetical protein RMK99_10130 [Anaerolineales bacterium]|nr:hypothetical protein [Anaerolineales bacterium]
MTWLTERIFVAGGDFVVAEWKSVQAQTGLSAIVSVDAEPPRLFIEPSPWAWLWLPVAGEDAYTLEYLSLGVQFIEAALVANRSVLLHGPKSMHRTRPLFAAYLLARGISLARVLREIELKPWLPPYRGDVELLKRFLEGRR